MRAVRITPDKRLAWVELAGLSSMQEQVGGLIERLPLRWGGSLYVNEDGKFLRLPPSSIATDLALHQGAIFPSDVIRGSAFATGPGDGQGGDLDFPEQLGGCSLLRLVRLIAEEAGGRWEELSSLGDVVICVEEPPSSNPYRGERLEGPARAELLERWRAGEDVGPATLWHAPPAGGARRLEAPDQVAWPPRREEPELAS